MNPAQNHDASIAIIGMSGRFPGARNLQEFWQNLRDGAESVSFFRQEELQWSPLDGTPTKEQADRVAARAILEDPDRFDAAFFDIDPGEAEIIDPQHRIFLECAWEALEDAACQPDTCDGLIGLFAGSSTNTYLLANLLTRRDLFNRVGSFPLIFAGGGDHLSTRVSYKLNLRGPSVNIQTACSTSLVAICIACQNLLNYQCDVALAGGVSISFPQKRAPARQERGTLAPDGHCRPFDAEAAGTVSGEGVGVVALKRLSDALANRDPIRAIIRGCAINNDGSLKSGYAAPGIDGQAEVIAMAQANAGVEPDSVSYIETHGTGDPVGDAIEIAGLTKAFRTRTTATNLCAIGSVKGNIGHLDAAAGAAGLIKTVLALQHRQLPPSLHFHRPNPKIDFANSPVWVNDTLRAWPNGRTPRRAGVSSFGIGGTNAHVVLEEAPRPEPSGPSRPWQLLVLSARTHTALETITDNLVQHLRTQPTLPPADVAFTLQVGRKPFAHRRMLLSQTVADAAQALAARDSQRVLSGQTRETEPPVVFLFPGEGAQYVNMSRQLYETEPVFRIELDRCCDILGTHLGLDMRGILFPETDSIREASQRLNQTFIAQPALFAVEYALARLWMRWGIRPQAMIGHGTGEYVAACLSGVFSLEDALPLVAARARLIQEQPTGAMLVVPLPEREVRILLGRKLSLAAVNGPSFCVASGPVDAIEILEKKLQDRGVSGRRLETSHALHSEMMEPVLHWFAAKVRKASLNPPGIPYVSNLTGTWITPRDATDPNCWVAHLRQTVRFADGLAEVARCGDPFCLEVGPGDALTVMARQHASLGPRAVLQSLGPQPEDKSAEVVSMLHALGRLWLGGVTVDWSEFHARQRRRRVPLPTYPFERNRYWIEPSNSNTGSSSVPVTGPGDPADSLVRKEPEHSQGAASKPTTTPEVARRRRQSLGGALQRLAQAGRLFSGVIP